MDSKAMPQAPANWKAPFFTVWAGQVVSLLGSSLVQFGLIWYLTSKTGSATVLATATLVGMLPQILLGPFAGTWVDRLNRRRVMIVADGLIALVSLAAALLFASGAIQIWHIYAVMLIRSAGGAFHSPAMNASTTLMVPNEQLSRIAGLNQTLYGAMNIVSPPLGALLVGFMPMQGLLLIDVVTAAVAIALLLFVSIPQPVSVLAPAGEQQSYWSDFKAGFRYMATWRGVMIIMAMAALLNFLLNPAFSLMPLLVTKHFGQGAIELAAMESAIGIGMVMGGLLLSVWGGFKNKMLTSLLGVAGMGVGVLVIGFSPSPLFWLALAGIAITGVLNPIANGPLNAVMQSSVAPEMQGRVMSLTGAFCTIMSPLSLAVAGPLSDRFGIQTWYIVAGAMCVLMALVMVAIPDVINLERDGKRRLEQAMAAMNSTAAENGGAQSVELSAPSAAD